MTPAIRVSGLSKCYRVGAAPAGARNASEVVAAAARGFARRVSGAAPPDNELFWALSDVSFDVFPGELVGVIGKNGAGKSTLLKLLTRITTPTRGRAEVRGRLGSLLEVGTGFHTELTGRENVYLNGSILGMSRAEIRKRFDAIVEFADVGRFLDTPVKRYSSGMYVRLAFAVAAHLEPDVLIVDEVLAVGDAQFQRKCIDRMTELTAAGRTVLFVTHNMQLVPQLCQRAVHLERGKVVEVGDATAVVRRYLDRLLEDARGGDVRDRPRTGDGRARFTRAHVVGPDGEPAAGVVGGEDVVVRVELEAFDTFEDASVAVHFSTPHGTRIVHGWTAEDGFPVTLTPGTHRFECRIERPPLRPGQPLLLGLWARTRLGGTLDHVEKALVVDVLADARHARLTTTGDQPALACVSSWRTLPTT